VPRELHYVTLVARLDTENRQFFDYHVVRGFEQCRQFHIKQTDPLLLRGEKLGQLQDFCEAVFRLKDSEKERLVAPEIPSE
jgi:hypothetical protein